MLDLVPQVLLNPLLLKHLLLPLGPEQHPGGHGDGDGVLRLRLQIERRQEGYRAQSDLSGRLVEHSAPVAVLACDRPNS